MHHATAYHHHCWWTCARFYPRHDCQQTAYFALVGYLLAGVLAGPLRRVFVADTKLAPELAELGVILLMFGVGLHFSLKDLMAVKSIAIPGAIAQIRRRRAAGQALSAGAGLVNHDQYRICLCLSTASTVVSLRALEEKAADRQPARANRDWLADS